MSTTTTEGLAGLQAAAASLDTEVGQGPAPGVPGVDQGPAPIDFNEEARDLVQFWRVLISSVGPSLAEIYDDATCDRLASALGPVLAKYDLNLGKFGPELVLAAVAVPLGVQTYKAVKAEGEKREQLAKQKPGDPPRSAEPDAQQPVIDKTDPLSLHNRA